jgi:transcriptional regulator with XRE-family HTH domain
MTIGERIRKLREERGWSRDELAARTSGGVRPNAIYKIETGRSHEMRKRQLDAIANAFGVTAAELRGEAAATTPVVAPEDRARLNAKLEDWLARYGRSGARVEELIRRLDSWLQR